jgi:hypothetical protein
MAASGDSGRRARRYRFRLVASVPHVDHQTTGTDEQQARGSRPRLRVSGALCAGLRAIDGGPSSQP